MGLGLRAGPNRSASSRVLFYRLNSIAKLVARLVKFMHIHFFLPTPSLHLALVGLVRGAAPLLRWNKGGQISWTRGAPRFTVIGRLPPLPPFSPQQLIKSYPISWGFFFYMTRSRGFDLLEVVFPGKTKNKWYARTVKKKSLSKVLRTILNVPWYAPNLTTHKDLNIPPIP